MCHSCSLVQAFYDWQRTMAPQRGPSTPSVDRRQLVRGAIGSAALLATSIGRAPVRAQEAADHAGGPATVVFRGGTIYTVDPDNPNAEAVAVRNRSIVAVGTDADMESFIGPDTRVIELSGRMVLPGFVESHIHPTVGSFATSGVDLQVESREEALAAITEYVKFHPEGTVRGFGWRMDMFPPGGPTKGDLDRILPDRPAFFFAIDVHSLWMNTRALEIAGITHDSQDPVPGFSYYARDANGEPTGFVLELPALIPAVDAIDPITVKNLRRLVQEWTPKAAAAGITSVFDAGILPVSGDQTAALETYLELERRELLRFRVFASYLVSKPTSDDVVGEALRLRQQIDTELVRIQAIKIVGDGTSEAYTALLLEPYADKRETRGTSPFSAEDLMRLVTAVDAAQLDVHVHSFGDGTTRAVLDAIAAAIKANPAYDRRHTLAHLPLVDDADMPRFAELNVIGQFSTNWMTADPVTVGVAEARFGPERAKRMLRPRALLNAHGRIALGTDWPGAGYRSTYKPLEAIQVAMTRQLIDRADAPILDPVDERMTLKQALHANTLGSAYQIRMEDQLGSITPGKLADLVVLERNLFDVDPHEIAAVAIDMTVMNGRFTHGDPN